MGTKVHCESYLPGYYSMRDLNEDSISSSWPLFNGDKTVANGQYFNGFMPKTAINGYPENDKDALKQKMIEHETVFRNQVYELHRLYRIQRDMMEEVKRKELHKQRALIEPSSSSSLQGFQMPSNDARKWHMAGFPLSNSGHGRTSILGVEIVTSPMSCTKGKENQMNQFLFPNSSTSKDCEALDSRPLKVKRKLFDLQLPAEEYVDSEEGENFQEYKVNARIEPENSFLRSHAGVKANCPIDASTSDSCLRRSVGLADLNKPVQIEESMSPILVDFHGNTSSNGKTKGMNQSAKSNARFLGVTSHDGFLMNSSVESEINKRGRFSHMYATGSSNNLGTHRQGLPQDKLPVAYNPGPASLNQLHHASGTYPTVYCKENLWRDGSNCGEFNSHLEPLVASQSSHPFFSSRCFPGSQAHSISSWTKPKGSFTQQITTSGSPSIQEHFERKWQANDSSRFNAGLRNEQITKNGFSHGFALGSKELQAALPSVGFGYLNCSQGDKVVSDHSINHGFGIFAKGSCHVDSKPVLDINLNEVVSNSSNEPWGRPDFNTVDLKGKHEDHVSALPWLRPKPTNGNEGDSSVPRASLCRNRETVRDLNQPYTPLVTLASNDCVIVEKKEIAETQNVQKILEFPIVDTIAGHEPSSFVSSSTIVDCPPDKNNKRKNIIIDINLAYEPEDLKANEEQHLAKATQGACYIDLNSCVSDCEDPPVRSCESQSNSRKVTKVIDLEAPVFLESDDDDTPSKENLPDIGSLHSLEKKAEQMPDEVLRNAADTLIAISSCQNIDTSEASVADSLLWFINTMSLCAIELECISHKESRTRDGSPLQGLSEEIDEYEAMTLQLVETKENDYMPRPFVPEAQIEDTGGNLLVTRTRRGQSRRGRQRRDFQRDILPGLTSLSRHEVTEDLQTFGGLMRATGHHWNSGLTRRNGSRNRSARGRRRAVIETVPNIIPITVYAPLVQQLNSIESGLEDRSLTGWGKTTRRPRRQRCPAGNPPTIALTCQSKAILSLIQSL